MPDTAAADSIQPPPHLPVFPDPVPEGWATGVWVWDREELLEAAALTLTDLLEQIPAVTPIRSGYFGLPQAVSAFGATGLRTRIIFDGYVLDPLAASTFDLSRLELAELRRVRVVRRPGLLRIEIQSARPSTAVPYSRVEAATGRFDTQLFRGIFLEPDVLIGPFGVAIERLSTSGFLNRRPAPTSTFSAWLQWGIISEDRGIQIEYRQSTVERGLSTPAAGSGERRDIILRGRSALADGLVAGAYIGRSSIRDDFNEPLIADSLETVFEETSWQAGLRAFYDAGRFWARSALRGRTGGTSARFTAELAGGTRFGERTILDGGVRWAYRPVGSALSGHLRAVLGSFYGFRPFVELAAGERGVDFLRDTLRSPVFTNRRMLRAGAAYVRGELRLGAAALAISTDSIPTFGLTFEGPPRLYPGGEALGFEARARVPLFWEPLTLEAWYTAWPNVRWIYMPRRSARAALTYHQLPLDSDNLEIIARVDYRRRGEMPVPLPQGGTALVPPLASFSFLLQIRVVTVRAFLRWDNFTNRALQFDVPGRRFPGQRVIYGVKWEFLN